MKTLYRSLLALCSAGLLYAVPAAAQDVLIRRTGEEIPVKVLEITPAEIKYRRTDNPDGPLISVWRTDVFKIRYANGTQDVYDQYGRAVAPTTSYYSK